MSILNYLERFCAFDYKDRNQEIYGQDTPPDYDLAKVTAPVALYWGDNDWLAQQTVSNDQSIASTKTKYIKLNTKTQICF